MFQELLGPDDHNKDIFSLDHSQKFTDFLIAHPNQVSGAILVMILSSSDDFALGLQSTQTEILRHLILGGQKLPADTSSILLAIDSLSDCQHRLFDAGDDYVELVTKYVTAEDLALGKTPITKPH
jgi:hypothetical protein